MSATGTSLKTLRESFGLSRMDVAAQFDLSGRWVEMLESGRINPNPAFVAKYTRAIVHAFKKKAHGERQLDAGSDRNPYQEEQIVKNGTATTLVPATVAVACSRVGCMNYGGTHETDPNEEPFHSAFAWWENMHCQVNVDLEAGRWSVSGVLSDDDRPLAPELVTAWMANYNSAVCLAAELNAGEASC
ncbi:hypothetical protein GCM10009706_29040 [Curtobacterium citreum]|uniref:Helix-turn-helix transcriptional regulator n=1 Tax=Curtobacterium citreum TaxID=2036 RepID=A0ABT2HKU4_9MICO|nr:helix-turn-helix transcriptional regulator [Curtobacterium citreum]MCS6523893.1 helix-turn-helix transcriptional regulator [Curtobacterium citreum]TQJ29004.1 helix-turn-helix protein [Curtobacterium citreum]GGL88573.1 hypothetical protein GCM10009706_29040 [Curtobacterium citreum]